MYLFAFLLVLPYSIVHVNFSILLQVSLLDSLDLIWQPASLINIDDSLPFHFKDHEAGSGSFNSSNV